MPSGNSYLFEARGTFFMNYSKNDPKCPKLNSSSFSIRNLVYKSVKYDTIGRRRFGVSVINSPSGVSLTVYKNLAIFRQDYFLGTGKIFLETGKIFFRNGKI